MRRGSRLGAILALASCQGGVGDAVIEPRPFLPDVTEALAGEVFRGTFSPDGSDFYFFSKVGEGEDYRVFVASTEGDSSTATLLPLGDANASSMYPAVSPDGNQLVFSSSRGGDNAGLWMAERSDAGWGEPRPIGASLSGHYNASSWFHPDGSLRFASTTPDWSETHFYRAEFADGDFAAAELDTTWAEFDVGEGYHLWSGLLHPGGELAILEVSARLEDGRLSPSDLWISRRVEGVWSVAAPLGGGVNTEGTENFPTFSPDGVTLVYVRDFEHFLELPVEALRAAP
ncbi:MAG: hypothetical protein AAF389_18475 [Gemmatimonadota bacterium]